MKPEQLKSQKIEELAMLAVRLGREVGEALEEMSYAGRQTASLADVNALLRRLQIGDLSDGKDQVTIRNIQSDIGSEIFQEARGTRTEPVVIGYDEDGAICEMQQLTVFTDKGSALQTLELLIISFIDARRKLMDRANADRLICRLMR